MIPRGINSIIIEGRIVRDFELCKSKNNHDYCNFCIAYNHQYTKPSGIDVQQASFFDVMVWGKLAIDCSKKAMKGSPIRITGYLKQNSWTSKDNVCHNDILIIAQYIEYIHSPNSKQFSQEAVSLHKLKIAQLKAQQKKELEYLKDAQQGAILELERQNNIN